MSMKVLIELYDERAIENVIGPETFRPEHVVYLCPLEICKDAAYQENLRSFFRHRGLEMTLEFKECSLLHTEQILHQLRKIADRYKDIALDITGGTDAALFASGIFCSERSLPVFTYSRRQNRFFNIKNAPFADEKPCTLQYSVEDFFRMTGGIMRPGRVDNRILHSYMDQYDPFFEVFWKYRKKWASYITFIQRISQADPMETPPLLAEGNYLQKGERGERIAADPDFLEDLVKIGWIRQLDIRAGESVSFVFKDLQIRAWLRDVGSVLELYMYKVCVDSGIFQDVVSSAVVDWDQASGHECVSNEIDVMAARGTVPVFISCKACEIKTPAINELAILRDRFGGKGAKAVIVTTDWCNAAARHRAAQLNIAVIDREELEAGEAGERIRVIMKIGKEDG